MGTAPCAPLARACCGRVRCAATMHSLLRPSVNGASSRCIPTGCSARPRTPRTPRRSSKKLFSALRDGGRRTAVNRAYAPDCAASRRTPARSARASVAAAAATTRERAGRSGQRSLAHRRGELAGAVRRLTNELPLRQRVVLILRDVVGWSTCETAAMLEISVVGATMRSGRRAGVHRRCPPVSRST
jgi:Sigma-70, region 4